MKQLEVAQAIAREAHEGQTYGDGHDYIEAHVEPIATMIAKLGYDESFQATGWLHDVVEDSDMTAEILLHRGIEPAVVDAVSLLTKRPGVPHGLYLTRISHNRLAAVAKFADSSHNYANTLLVPYGNQEKYRERVATYVGNIVFLREFLPMPTDSNVVQLRLPSPDNS
jgi:(p)ppGpp synthase/HD superfamily hydrolase